MRDVLCTHLHGQPRQACSKDASLLFVNLEIHRTLMLAVPPSFEGIDEHREVIRIRAVHAAVFDVEHGGHDDTVIDAGHGVPRHARVEDHSGDLPNT